MHFFFKPYVGSSIFIQFALRFLSTNVIAQYAAILHSVLVLSVLMLQKKLIVWED